jgi:CheY-like chemotaxis protein
MPSPAQSSAKEADANQSVVCVLVVDDDFDIREVLTEILNDAGYTVATASNGAEALATLRTTTPELILLDLNMPVMNGTQFRQLQLEDPTLARIPTIAMTAADRLRERTAVLNVEEALPKPLSFERLFEVIRRHCKHAPAS